MVNEIQITEIEGEPGIHDEVLAIKLGYDEPRDIRKLIKRNLEELQRYGGLRHRGANLQIARRQAF